MKIDITAELANLPKHSRGRKVMEQIAKAATTAELQEHVMLEKMAKEIQEAVEFEPMLGDVAFLLDGGLS